MRWIAFNVLFVASCGYALRKGGPSERLTVLALTADRLLTIIVRIPGPGRYEHFQTGIFLVDLATFVVLLGLALFTKRWWPLWMTGLAGAAAASHVVRLSPIVNGFAYYTLIAVWMYPMLLLLLIATWRKGRRRSAAS